MKHRAWEVLCTVVTTMSISSAHGAAVTLSGTVEGVTDKTVSYFVGSSGEEIGLKFFAKGPVSYNYAFTFDAGLALTNATEPLTLTAGSSITLLPYYRLQSATLTATQSIAYGTTLEVDYDPPIPLISNIEFSENLPDVSIEGVRFDLAGSGALTTSGQSIIDGHLGVSTGTGIFSAWGASVDLVWLAAQLFGEPAATLESVVGTDLNVSLVMDILRTDYLFIDDLLFDTNPITLNVPMGEKGTPFRFLESRDLAFGLSAYSVFDYQGAVDISFDLFDFHGRGTSTQSIFHEEAGNPWHVGTMKNIFWPLSEQVNLISDSFEIGQVVDPWFFDRIQEDYQRSYDPRPLPAGGRVFSINYDPAGINDVPEPGTLVLALVGIFGLAARLRKT